MIICSYISISCDLFWFIPLFKNANESRWCRRRSTSNNQYIPQSENQGEAAPHSQARNPRQKISRETLAVEKPKLRLNQHPLNSQNSSQNVLPRHTANSLPPLGSHGREMNAKNQLCWAGMGRPQGGKAAQSSGDLGIACIGQTDSSSATLEVFWGSTKEIFPWDIRFGVVFTERW